jgi:hypothetical protein
MQNLTNAIDAVMDKEAIQFKAAIVNELSQRLYKALDGERANVANSVISGVAESNETKEEVKESANDTINEKVELDGRTSLYRSTVTRIEQSRKMREQKSKDKGVAEGDEKFKGLYDDGSGKGASIPKPLDINPSRFQHITKESVEINEDQYAEAVIMQNGKYTMKEAELSAKQKEYRKFFDAAMKKFGVKSPSDFSNDAKKKEFFDYIQKNWKG